MDKSGIRLDKFLQVFGKDGVKFYPLDENLPEAETDVYDVNEVTGYGVFVTGRGWQVFDNIAKLKLAVK